MTIWSWNIILRVNVTAKTDILLEALFISKKQGLKMWKYLYTNISTTYTDYDYIIVGQNTRKSSIAIEFLNSS